jgi:hypothetical protein
MKPSSILRALAATALLTVAASAADAQAAAQTAASATPWVAIPAGTYKLDIQLTERVLPATVVIRDSSGVAAATFQPEGDPSQPVRVTIKGTELFVNGEAPKGPFEIVLLREADAIAGRWSYAGETGKLTGKVEK